MLDSKFFVSRSTFPKEVTLPDGTKHTLHFRQLPAAAFRKFALAERSADPAIRAAGMPELISQALCTQEGEPVLTVQEAQELNLAAANALFEVVTSMGESPDKGNA